MSGHVIWDLWHKLFENNENEALSSFFYLFLIKSCINFVLLDHKYNVQFNIS